MKIGIVGGGQLGRMLALAGHPLGFRFRFLDPNPESPAAELGEMIVAEYDDPEALERFGDGLDLVTYEFENVPVQAARRLASERPVYPPPAALEMAQDRLEEKSGFDRLGIPTPVYRAVSSREELDAATEEMGLPGVLKTRRFGYDGKGQRVLTTPDEVDAAWNALGEHPLILEQFVEFSRELSIVGMRTPSGEMEFYPLVENHHRDGILRLTLAPARELTPELQAVAQDYLSRILVELEYVGVLALELFQVDGHLLANEMAPRVHNSGHWTQDGAICSQFENHLRAIAGLPLGDPSPRLPTAMVNLIGEIPDPASVLETPNAYLHLYDKAPRPGRKLGHVNIVSADSEEIAHLVSRLSGL